MKLHVFIQPSPFESAWKEAVSRSADAHGWRIAEAPDPLGGPAEDNYVVITSAIVPLVFGPDVVAIISGDRGPDYLSSIGFTNHDALRRSAHFLAYASEIGAHDGAVLNASDEILTLPHIGEVHRAALTPLPPAKLNADALGIYRSLPPPVGARAEWTPDLFAYNTKLEGLCLGAAGNVDLTGRARLLIFGPQITLSPGSWSVTVSLLVDPENSRSRLTISWGDTERQKSRAAEIEKLGIYKITLTNEWQALSEAELKIFSDRPHFRGVIRLVSVVVHRESDERK
jgi:hypothetical protein